MEDIVQMLRLEMWKEEKKRDFSLNTDAGEGERERGY